MSLGPILLLSLVCVNGQLTGVFGKVNNYAEHFLISAELFFFVLVSVFIAFQSCAVEN